MVDLKSVRSFALVLATLVGCTDAEPVASSSVFVGELAASSTSIAVVADSADGEAAIYVCDGVTIAAWLFGTRSGDAITARGDDGSTLEATIAAGRVTGRLARPGLATVTFSAALADGVAGLYLVKQSGAQADGFSAAGGELHGEVAGASLSGTVETVDGVSLALRGAASLFGESSGVATWIVQPDGRVSGRITNTAGGGNCSIWAKIKQISFGVHCSFF